MQYIDAGQKVFLSTNDLSGVTSGLYGANIGATNLSGQYLFVKMDSTANSVVLASGATDAIIGVVMNAPAAGDNAVVRLRNASGTLPVVVGATPLTVGCRVTTDSAGRGIPTTSSGNEVCGIAAYAAAAGDIAEIIPFTGKY